MNCYLKNILHINLHILLIIHIKTSSRIHELSKSIKYIKDTYKVIFVILFNLLCICNTFEFKVEIGFSGELRLIQSCVNVNHMRT